VDLIAFGAEDEEVAQLMLSSIDTPAPPDGRGRGGVFDVDSVALIGWRKTRRVDVFDDRGRLIGYVPTSGDGGPASREQTLSLVDGGGDACTIVFPDMSGVFLRGGQVQAEVTMWGGSLAGASRQGRRRFVATGLLLDAHGERLGGVTVDSGTDRVGRVVAPNGDLLARIRDMPWSRTESRRIGMAYTITFERHTRPEVRALVLAGCFSDEIMYRQHDAVG
jgi:hypothetical protein